MHRRRTRHQRPGFERPLSHAVRSAAQCRAGDRTRFPAGRIAQGRAGRKSEAAGRGRGAIVLRAAPARGAVRHNNDPGSGGDLMIRNLMRGTALASALALPLFCSAAIAQIAVSANDNKIALVDGVNTVPANPPPDTVTVLDIGVSPPKVLGEVQAPSSVVGVPQSVAVAKDESFAIVTSAMKVDPADPKKIT